MDNVIEAYNQGLRIRKKNWTQSWIKKYNKNKCINEIGSIDDDAYSFWDNPFNWEIHPDDKHLFKSIIKWII